MRKQNLITQDIDHLVTFNKNGLWIKENLKNGNRIITANRPDGLSLIDVTIFHLDKEYNLSEKIISKSRYKRKYMET